MLAAVAVALLLLGLVRAAITTPVLAQAVLALSVALSVLAVIVMVSLMVMLAVFVGRDRGRAPSRRDPAVREALRLAPMQGYPNARVVTIAGLAVEPGRVGDLACLAHELLAQQEHVLIAGAANEQLRRRYCAMGFQSTPTTGRRGLVRAPDPLDAKQAAYLQRLMRVGVV